MDIGEQTYSATLQVLAVLFLSSLIYGVYWLRSSKQKLRQSLSQFIGLKSFSAQLDSRYFLILLALICFAVLSTYLQFESESFRRFLTGENSPYGKILRTGFDFKALQKAAIYCFVQAAASEELLFRGLLAKRLYSKLGHAKGNAVQALFFWLMHLGIFGLITGEWISWVQLFVFLTSFGLGLVLGYVNFRKHGESIGPSWILHGSVNFISFLTLAVLSSSPSIN